MADEISAAVDWYEERSAGLGERLRCEVDARFNQILGNPDVFPRGSMTWIFVSRLQKFPYSVMYRVRVNTVYVLGVFHSAMDPEKWRRRATR